MLLLILSFVPLPIWLCVSVLVILCFSFECISSKSLWIPLALRKPLFHSFVWAQPFSVLIICCCCPARGVGCCCKCADQTGLESGRLVEKWSFIRISSRCLTFNEAARISVSMRSFSSFGWKLLKLLKLKREAFQALEGSFSSFRMMYFKLHREAELN